MRTTRIIAVVCGGWAIALIGLIVWSSFEMSLAAGLKLIAGTGWGITTLVDLYAGLLFAAGWIAACERARGRGWVSPIAWLLAMLFTGNLALLVYAAVRAWSAPDVMSFISPVPRVPAPAP